MRITFHTKLLVGFIVLAFLSAMIAWACQYLNYFGWFTTQKAQIAFLGLSSLLVGLLGGLGFGYYIISNIKNLTQATSVISKGDLRQKLAVLSDDELGSLASAFNKMIESLVEMIEEVKKVSDTIYNSALNLSA